MQFRAKVAAGVAVLALAGAAGTAVAAAGGGGGDDDGDQPVTGPEADRATAAAVDATGGGTANAVERDNENGATWEVEVTKPDGATVDVRLDENYGVVVIEGDSETDHADGGADDGDEG
jgi:uncharacterized membrane protein YkoI